MDSIVIVAFNTVFPLLAMMLTGVLLRSLKLIDDGTVKHLNLASSKVFIPFLLFNNVYRADLRSAFNLRLFLFELTFVFLLFAILFVAVPRLVKDRKTQYSVLSAMSWPNCTMFGLPILASLFGSAGTEAGTIMIVTVAPFFSAGSVVITELYRNSERMKLGNLLKSVAKNPMLWGSVLGLTFNLCGIKLPVFLASPISTIASIAAPLALITLGAFCKRGSFSSLRKPAIWGILFRLFLFPALVLAGGVLFGYSGMSLLGLVIIFASPSAVSTFSLANPRYANTELSALYVSATSLLSVASYFIWIVLLRLTGLC
ncbi:MAG: AEC family transporter [Oscillospiraceae bacterium]